MRWLRVSGWGGLGWWGRWWRSLLRRARRAEPGWLGWHMLGPVLLLVRMLSVGVGGLGRVLVVSHEHGPLHGGHLWAGIHPTHPTMGRGRRRRWRQQHSRGQHAGPVGHAVQHGWGHVYHWLAGTSHQRPQVRHVAREASRGHIPHNLPRLQVRLHTKPVGHASIAHTAPETVSKQNI